MKSREETGKNKPPKHTRFKPGQSGNPKGRPKKIPAIDELLAEVLGEEKDGKTAAQVILMALRAKATKGDVRAAEVLLERAYGKVKERHELSGPDGGPIETKFDITLNLNK
jgi:hypothetical protein